MAVRASGRVARRTFASCAIAATQSALSLFAAVPDSPAPAIVPLLSDSEVIARAGLLPLDERRYLVYLYARLEKAQVAEALANSILAQVPDDRQTLLVLASMYLENKDAAALRRTAQRLLAAHPHDQQGRYFFGAAQMLAGDFAEAGRVLRDLKREQFAGREFPYEGDLAASALAEGDWYRARLSYEELLRHRQLSGELRREVQRALDGIQREHRPRIELSAAQTKLDLAAVWRTVASHGRHLSARHWLELRSTHDDVTLESAPTLRAVTTDRTELSASLATTHVPRWRSETWAGLFGEGAFGGLRAHHAFGAQREASLEFAANLRATDSLTLEALDGRQHHAALAASWLLARELTLNARVHAREVRVADQPLGRGTGLDLNLDRTLRTQSPRVTAGYRSAVATFLREVSFSPEAARPVADPAGGVPAQQAIVENLVSRRINRHGTGLLVTDNLADAWLYRLTAGVDYDFVLSSTGWNAGLGLTWVPRRNIELTVEGGYTSSATASNAGSAATLLNLSLRAYF